MNNIINEHNETQYTNENNMTITEELILFIKKWIKIDNEIINLKTELKNNKLIKKELTNHLIKIMQNNNIDCFNINDGLLIYKKKQIKQNLSAKFLYKKLEEYYIDTPNKAEELTKFILENREEKIIEDLRHKIDKNK